jgi:osmoprotectant transport system ATP-binding protein
VSGTAIEFAKVTKRFEGTERPAVDDLDLAVRQGETVALIGPSGCGKTTTLKMINRLVEPTSGTISVNGRNIRDLPLLALRRSLGYVIQHVGLFPHMTIARNIAVVPELLGWDKARIRQRVDELLALVGLEPGQYRGRRPAELSGGQQQRVGVARALAADPPILLMDEPFGALDPITRGNLQNEIADIQRKLRKTVVIVTHDMDEAVRLADRIVVMDHGAVAQSGTPEELLLTPASDFVSELLGSDRLIMALQTVRVDRFLEPSPGEPSSPPLSGGATMHDALRAFMETGASSLSVADEQGAVIGSLPRSALFRLQAPEPRA